MVALPPALSWKHRGKPKLLHLKRKLVSTRLRDKNLRELYSSIAVLHTLIGIPVQWKANGKRHRLPLRRWYPIANCGESNNVLKDRELIYLHCRAYLNLGIIIVCEEEKKKYFVT